LTIFIFEEFHLIFFSRALVLLLPLLIRILLLRRLLVLLLRRLMVLLLRRLMVLLLRRLLVLLLKLLRRLLKLLRRLLKLLRRLLKLLRRLLKLLRRRSGGSKLFATSAFEFGLKSNLSVAIVAIAVVQSMQLRLITTKELTKSQATSTDEIITESVLIVHLKNDGSGGILLLDVESESLVPGRSFAAVLVDFGLELLAIKLQFHVGVHLPKNFGIFELLSTDACNR
jgi:hypothetical protein